MRVRRRKPKLKLVREKMLDDPWKDFPPFDPKELPKPPVLDDLLKDFPPHLT